MNTVIINGINVTEELEKLKITNASLVIVKHNLAKELNELKRDVARFMELTFSDNFNHDDWQEYLALKNRLSKVGKEE